MCPAHVRDQCLVVSTFRRHHVRTVCLTIVRNRSKTFVTLSVVIVCRCGCFCRLIPVLTRILSVHTFSPAHVSPDGRRWVGIFSYKVSKTNFSETLQILQPTFILHRYGRAVFFSHTETSFTSVGKVCLWVEAAAQVVGHVCRRHAWWGINFQRCPVCCLPVRPQLGNIH
jgi:hypothetical protein